MKDHGEMCVKLAQLDKVCTEEKKRKRSLVAEYARLCSEHVYLTPSVCSITCDFLPVGTVQ